MNESDHNNGTIHIVFQDPDYKSKINNTQESTQNQEKEVLSEQSTQSLMSEPTQALLHASNSPPPAPQQSNPLFMGQYPPTMPIYPLYSYDEDILPLHLMLQAGLRLDQAQDLNYLYTKLKLELNNKNKEMQLELNRIFGIEYIHKQFKPAPVANVPITDDTTVGQFSKLIDEFINETKITQDFENTHDIRIVSVYIWYEEKYNRHFNFNETELIGKFKKYLHSKLKDKFRVLSSKTVEQLVVNLKYKIPEFEKSNLIPLAENSVRLNDAIYDLTTENFQHCDPSTNIFNRFSILTSAKNYDEPAVFDKLLDDITGEDKLIKQLIYEVIGAVLSNSKLLKRIFVFQGVSNGGKTRLMQIIAQLLIKFDVAFVDTISEVTGDNFKKSIKSKHLVCVNDSADKKLPSMQVSYLKSFADGNVQNSDNVTRIIMATNYAIKSGNEEYVEPALKNRLLVVPFKKPMDNVDEEVANFEVDFFEKEKHGIVIKALKCFSKVIRNGRKFCYEHALNDPAITVSYNSRENISLTNADREKIAEIKNQSRNFSDTTKSKLYQVFAEMFEINQTDNITMSSENIMTQIQKIDPMLISNMQQLGKDLKNYFGEKLKSNRESGQTFYNLNYKK